MRSKILVPFISIIILIGVFLLLGTDPVPSHQVFFQPGVSKSPKETEQRIVEDIQDALGHPNMVKGLMVSQKPSTAVIVGAGTIGVEAIVFAVNNLPKGSTIVVFQHTSLKSDELAQVFKKYIPGANDDRFIISEKMDLGELEKIQQFLDQNRYYLTKTSLYIHTADRAVRFVPDAMPVDAVISQVIRRASATVISEYLDEVNPDHPIVKVLVSSECCQDRSCYRIPNLAPYQMGKVVGDELFRTSSRNGESINVIAYSGPMATHGQVKARTSEYEMLKKRNSSIEDSSAVAYVKRHEKTVDISPMDSIGMMLKEVIEAVASNKLKTQTVYSIYGPSINPELEHPVGVLIEEKPADYMWPPLEQN